MNAIDEKFYDKYIKISNRHDAFEMFAEIKRFAEFMDESSNQFDFTTRAHTVIKKLTKDKNYDLALFKSRIIVYYNKINFGQELLGILLPDTNYKEMFKNDETMSIVLNSDTFEERLKNYIENMANEKLVKIIKTFGLDEKTYNTQIMDKWKGKKCSGFIQSVLKKAFGIKYKVESKCRCTQNIIGTKSISVFKLNEMMNKYNPKNILPNNNPVFPVPC